MLERTIITSSLSKTYSVTGWRVGWAIAPADISSAIQNIHVKITDSAPAPFQEAAVTALQSCGNYYKALKQEYENRLNTVCSMLNQAGFKIPFRPQGSFFVFAKLPENYGKSDMDCISELIEKAGIAMVPGCGFFHVKDTYDKQSTCNYGDTAGVDVLNRSIDNSDYRTRYVRVAFCKEMSTLRRAAEAMSKCNLWQD